MEEVTKESVLLRVILIFSLFIDSFPHLRGLHTQLFGLTNRRKKCLRELATLRFAES